MAGTGGLKARAKRKNRPTHGIGPDGPRTQRSPGGGVLRDRGRPANRQLRENPKPKRGVTFGQPPKRERKPARNGSQRRPKRPTRPPVDPYNDLVNSYANLKYGEKERAYAQQGAVEAQRGVNQDAWYTKLYQGSLQMAQQQQAGALAQQQAAYAQGNATLASDTTQNASLLAQQNQQAAIRGTATDPALAQQMQQGAQVRQQQQTGFGNLVGQLGQNQAGYAGARVVQAGEQGIQAQADTQARQRKVESLSQELLGLKGDYKAVVRKDLSDTAHKQRLEDKAFGLDVAQEQFDQQDSLADNSRMSAADRARRRDARGRRRETGRHNRETESQGRARESRMRAADLADDGKLNSSSGSAGKFTPTQVRSGRQSLRNLVGRVKSNVDPPDSVDPLLAQAAVQIADKGGVTPKLARKIRAQYGFTPKIKKTSWQKKAGDKGREAAQDFFR